MSYLRNSLMVCLLLGFSTICRAAGECEIKLFEDNLATPSAVQPNSHNIYSSPDPKKSIYIEKRLPCTIVDLLELGFDIKSSHRYGPKDSSNGGFEDIMLLQKGKFAIACYSEFAVKMIRGKSTMTGSGDLACQQIVQPRVFSN